MKYQENEKDIYKKEISKHCEEKTKCIFMILKIKLDLVVDRLSNQDFEKIISIQLNLVHQILELFLLYLMVDPFHQNDIILLTTNRLEKEIFIFRYLSFFFLLLILNVIL